MRAISLSLSFSLFLDLFFASLFFASVFFAALFFASLFFASLFFASLAKIMQRTQFPPASRGVAWQRRGWEDGGGPWGGSGGSRDGRGGAHGSGSSGGDGHWRLADASATISNKTKPKDFSLVSTPAQRSPSSSLRHQGLNPGRSGEGRVS